MTNQRKVSEKMEQSMHKNYGFGFEEYERSLTKKLKVEREREKSYKENLKLYTDMNNRLG
ncbi:hypothetical protein [Halalkalibacterium ligniniphilum]|uniref:hypothetical protein n=1 Tax=Halalkalibacterium ligniniphilum TaxID=1134413 RepID=UPI00034944BA|nr:hypothetical protein [Halalkalibacterium ligniniphilum]